MTKIKKIVIEIGKKEIELSLDEAEELQDILNKLFGNEKIVTVPQPYPVPYYPYTWKRWVIEPYVGDYPNITVSDGTNTTWDGTITISATS